MTCACLFSEQSAHTVFAGKTDSVSLLGLSPCCCKPLTTKPCFLFVLLACSSTASISAGCGMQNGF